MSSYNIDIDIDIDDKNADHLMVDAWSWSDNVFFSQTALERERVDCIMIKKNNIPELIKILERIYFAKGS